eukprot:scaffold187331_cov63-Attheya_sp.AAC.4
MTARYSEAIVPDKPTLSQVMSLSRVIDKKWHSIIACLRKSIDIHYDSCKRTDPFTDHITQVLCDDPHTKTPLYQAVGHNEQDNCDSLAFISCYCQSVQLDPFSYHLTWVNFILRLIEKFDLDL